MPPTTKGDKEIVEEYQLYFEGNRPNSIPSNGEGETNATQGPTMNDEQVEDNHVDNSSSVQELHNDTQEPPIETEDLSGVTEEKTVIHELTQGLQMAQQLRLNMHSPEARNLLIQKILSSYENALFVLQSGGQPFKSSISIESPGNEEFAFDQPLSGQQSQNVISKKRKGSATWEDEVRICSGNGLEDNTDDGYNWRKNEQKDILGAKFSRSYYNDPIIFETVYKGKHTCNLGAQAASPPPPPSPEYHEPTLAHRQLSPPNHGEMLSNLRANLSVNTSNLGGYTDTVPSSFSFPSTSSGLMEDLHQFHFPNYYDEELWQVCSPFISPTTSESNFFTDWGSSSSLDLLTGPTDVDSDFEFMNSLF
ncbi:hypothetical protein L1987_09700 [Smallanthus sonchifolius]|uniref:Uncharacterized protein n=1 Tax=Smallanthus sonchifolius TaxID=185202 RepID=A0ACB9JQ37_9ASTR|nr:hypothetical protein L1987_09700 [Smallanthus sonchifolius]